MGSVEVAPGQWKQVCLLVKTSSLSKEMQAEVKKAAKTEAKDAVWTEEAVRQEAYHRSSTAGKVNALFGSGRVFTEQGQSPIYCEGKQPLGLGGQHKVMKGVTGEQEVRVVRQMRKAPCVRREDGETQALNRRVKNELTLRSQMARHLPDDPTLLKQGMIPYQTSTGKLRFVEVSPHCNQGSMGPYLARNQGLPMSARLRLAEEMAHSVEVLHAAPHPYGVGIAHRDLKVDNWFVHQDQQGLHVKLGDVNDAVLVREGKTQRPLAGTFPNFSPQQVGQLQAHGWPGPAYNRSQELETTLQDDCWNLGIALYTLTTGALPSPLKEIDEMPGGIRQDMALRALHSDGSFSRYQKGALARIDEMLQRPELSSGNRHDLCLQRISLQLMDPNTATRMSAAQAQQAIHALRQPSPQPPQGVKEGREGFSGAAPGADQGGPGGA